MLHLGEGRAGVFRERGAKEALANHVLDDVGERDNPRDALGDVGPVAGPGVHVHIDAAAEGDPDAVAGVEGERNEDERPLKDADQRQAVEEFDLLRVGEGAIPGFEVGDDVLDEKGADGDNAGERMQAAPEIAVAFAGAQRLD